MKTLYTYVNPLWRQGKYIMFQPEETETGIFIKKNPVVEFLIPIPGSVVVFQGDIGHIPYPYPEEFLLADCDVVPEEHTMRKIYDVLGIV